MNFFNSIIASAQCPVFFLFLFYYTSIPLSNTISLCFSLSFTILFGILFYGTMYLYFSPFTVQLPNPTTADTQMSVRFPFSFIDILTHFSLIVFFMFLFGSTSLIAQCLFSMSFGKQTPASLPQCPLFCFFYSTATVQSQFFLCLFLLLLRKCNCVLSSIFTIPSPHL
jgi:hypothetical protein